MAVDVSHCEWQDGAREDLGAREVLVLHVVAPRREGRDLRRGITFDKLITQPLFVGGLFLTDRLTNFAPGNKTLGLQLFLALLSLLCGTKESALDFVRT